MGGIGSNRLLKTKSVRASVQLVAAEIKVKIKLVSALYTAREGTQDMLLLQTTNQHAGSIATFAFYRVDYLR